MKIAILKPEFQSGVEYYRLDPWQVLGRQTGAIVTPLSSKYSNDFKSRIKGFDILVASRPRIQSDLYAIMLAKECGVYVILDYDDLIWEIPQVNPVSTTHNEESSGYVEILFQANAIIASTKALQTYIRNRFGLESHVVPNALNDLGTTYLAPAKDDKTITVAWRGSNTHDGDLFQVRDAFRDYPNVIFRFMGGSPWYFLSLYGGHLPYLNHHAWSSMTEFHHRFHALKPHYGVFPLEDNQFNQCKSNIAFLDYTKVGAVTIAPVYMQEFTNLPCIHYTNTDELQQIFSTIHERKDRAALLAQAREYINDNLLLTKVNALRVEVIDSLEGRGV